jgi:glycosyltransferase involved in cell wall biosynthesis
MNKSTRRKVLMVTYYFPPTNTIGGLRMSKFTKYLEEFGWDFHVLTSQPHLSRPQDDVLEIKPKKVTRSKNRDPIADIKYFLGFSRDDQKIPSAESADADKRKRQLRQHMHLLADTIFPDRSSGWYRYALRDGERLLREEPFDLILSSCLPFTANRVASRLQSISGLPWIADYRDLWSQSYTIKRNSLYRKFLEGVERRVNKDVICLTTVSEPLARNLETLHKKKAFVIYNGFDAQEYMGLEIPGDQTRFSVVYTGSIYKDKRDPTPIFEAVSRLLKKGIITPDRFEIHFYGTEQDIIREMANLAGIESVIHLHGHVPLKDSIKAQKSATLLLMLPWKDESQEGFLSAKIFEYLGSGRPILSVGPEDGSVERLLKETGGGISIRYAGDVEKVLHQKFAEFVQYGKIKIERKEDVIQQYTRREQTRILAQIFDEVIASRLC